MFEHILSRMKEKIRAQNYIMTLHAEEEMKDDGLTILKVEQAFLNAEILEQQKDALTSEGKYRLRGKTDSGDTVEVIAKLSPTGKLVIITVYII